MARYRLSQKGDGVDLLCKAINSDVVTGDWCITVVTTADSIMVGELRNLGWWVSVLNIVSIDRDVIVALLMQKADGGHPRYCYLR